MWGLLGYGMFRIIRGLYRKVTSAIQRGRRLIWIFGSIMFAGGIVIGGMAFYNVMNPSQLTSPSESFIVCEENSFWEDEILSILNVNGVVTNTHSEWSVENMTIELEAIDEEGNVIKTYKVTVIPSTIPPGGKGVYSERLQLPYACMGVDIGGVWEWVPP